MRRPSPTSAGGLRLPGPAALLLGLLVPHLAVATSTQAQAPPGGDPSPNPVARLLGSGHAVFGVFSGEQTREQGARVVGVEGADFVLYSMERGPFDLEGMRAYVAGMRAGGGEGILKRLPLILRVPPLSGPRAVAAERVRRAVEGGVGGVVFPHVETPEQAALSVELVPDPWPGNPQGRLLDILIVEDRAGVENVREIVSTPGVGVVFAGPGDLSRAYEGDAEAVERAIQAVLAACLAFDVPCGVTAGVHDIVRRLEEGFRVFIVTETEALEVGREAAGRG